MPPDTCNYFQASRSRLRLWCVLWTVLAGDALEIFFEGRVVGILCGSGAEFDGGIGAAALLFKDESKLPMGGPMSGSTGFGFAG